MAQNNPQVSIIVPTYNESQNIIGILKSIRENLPKGIHTETIVVDDNSPDGTGRIVEDYMIVETSNNFDCFDLARTSRNFQKKVYGIKIALHSSEEKKTLILLGLVDDILLECVNQKHLEKKLENLYLSSNKITQIEV